MNTGKAVIEAKVPGNDSGLYLPADLVPVPSLDERVFWSHCAGRHLKFQRCGACGHHRHPPGPICTSCQSDRIEWVEAPQAATVYSYTIVHHPSHPAMRSRVPYNVALITFAGLDEVRLISNVVDATAEQMVIGMAVRLHWEGPVGGYWLPRFRRTGETS